MPFHTPVLGNIKAKVLLVGGPGVGKTHAALTFPNAAVIDAEGSVDLFADEFTFVSKATKSLGDANDLIDEVIRGGVKVGNNRCETLVIDSLTSIYNTVQFAAMADNGSIEQLAWGVIKRRFADFFESMYVKTPVHVVATAWSKPKFVNTKDKNPNKPGELLFDGEVIDCDRKIAHGFDLIFKLKADEATGKRSAVCLKARGIFNREFTYGQEIPGGFSWKLIEPIIAQYQNKGERIVGRTHEESIEQERKLLQESNVKQPSEHQVQLSRALGAYKAYRTEATIKEAGKAIIDTIVYKYKLTERPENSSKLTADQLSFAADHFIKCKLDQEAV